MDLQWYNNFHNENASHSKNLSSVNRDVKSVLTIYSKKMKVNDLLNIA